MSTIYLNWLGGAEILCFDIFFPAAAGRRLGEGETPHGGYAFSEQRLEPAAGARQGCCATPKNIPLINRKMRFLAPKILYNSRANAQSKKAAIFEVAALSQVISQIETQMLGTFLALRHRERRML